MGCAPSIHVSQSGIVICPGQEDITGERSSPRPRASSPSEIVGHIPRSSTDSGSRNSTSSSSRFRVNSYKKPQYSARGSSVEAETQTRDLGSMDDKPKAKVVDCSREITLGPMKLHQNPMQIMLVFAKEDAQSESFLQAAERGRFKCQLCKSSEAAMELYLNNQPEVIVIDMRGNSPIDGERLCKNIRASRPNENTHSIIIAVVKPCPPGADEHSFLPLLKAGFDRRFVQNENVGGCYNELIMLEAGEVRSQVKLRGASCLLAALEHTHDAVEITAIDPDSSDVEVQYVNPAFEKMTGFLRDEVIGTSRSLANIDQSKPVSKELYEAIHSQLKKGKGVQIIPVGQPGKISYHVTIKQDMTHPNSLHNQVNMKMNVNMHMETPTTTSSGSQQVEFSTLANGGLLHRRQSTTTTRIEAPITKVINMLNAAQENSPLSVVQALDRVVEILRTAELYSPFTGQTTEEETKEAMANDLVGGLISNGRRRFSAGFSDLSRQGHGLHRESSQMSNKSPLPLHLPEAPAEVIAALVDEADWDFDIIKLEKGSNHRPLYYLGLKTMRRFRVCETLNIGEDVLKNWLQLIENNYHSSNAYHNSTHAADVLHATAVFLAKERVKAVLEPLDEVASLIAAVVHDVDHPGYTNSFLCNAGKDLAILYNDIAVLESHHSALAFKLTAQFDRSNIFKGLDIEEFRNIRQSIIDMVMATEMTRHFEHLSKFVNSINKRRSSSLDEVHSVHSGRGTPDSTASSTTALNTPENRTLIKRMLIKCADIANPARPRHLCKEWAFRISEEYFCQTDEEKKRGLPVVMPVFDRATCNVPRAQVWFIDYFVSDLYDAWDAFAFVPETIRHLTDNYDYWKRAAEELDATKAAQAAQNNISSNATSNAVTSNDLAPDDSGLTVLAANTAQELHSSSAISLSTSVTSA